MRDATYMRSTTVEDGSSTLEVRKTDLRPCLELTAGMMGLQEWEARVRKVVTGKRQA